MITTATATKLVVGTSNNQHNLKVHGDLVINKNIFCTGSCEFLVGAVASNFQFIVHYANRC